MFFYFSVPHFFGDDVNFLNYSQNELSKNFQTSLAYLQDRYNTWSSRIFIEVILMLVIRSFFLWRLLTAITVITLVWIINVYFNRDKSLKILIVSMGLFLLIPPLVFSNAGWIATTLNYLWPLTAGLLSAYPVFCRLSGKRVKAYLYIPCLLLFVFACNQEQILACILGVLVLGTIYFLTVVKKNSLLLIPYWLIAILSGIFIQFSPGNKMRFAKEVSGRFADYNQIGFFHKIEMGYATLGHRLFFSPSLITIVFLQFYVSPFILLIGRYICE